MDTRYLGSTDFCAISNLDGYSDPNIFHEVLYFDGPGYHDRNGKLDRGVDFTLLSTNPPAKEFTMSKTHLKIVTQHGLVTESIEVRIPDQSKNPGIAYSVSVQHGLRTRTCVAIP